MFPINRPIGLALLLFGAIGISCGVAADFNVGNNGFSDYVINGVNDPTLTLVRGRTYTFAINTPSHPFWIKTNAVTGNTASYTNGVANNGTGSGTLTFAVPVSAPNSLVYICSIHSAMQGTLIITNPPPAPAVISNARQPAPGQFSFDVVGTVGRTHVIEATTNAASGWAAIGTNPPPNASFTFTDNNAGAFSTMFYRVVTR
jgi:hypothetical protein